MLSRAILVVLVIAQISATPYPAKPVTKALFCAFGSIGIQPKATSPETESQFATVVVEINSPRKVEHAEVTEFVLIDPGGKTTPMKRVITVERFDEKHTATEGKFAYFTKTDKGSGTRPWDGTLPAGKILLRVHVALVGASSAPTTFRLTVGGFTVEGPVDGSWPT